MSLECETGPYRRVDPWLLLALFDNMKSVMKILLGGAGHRKHDCTLRLCLYLENCPVGVCRGMDLTAPPVES